MNFSSKVVHMKFRSIQNTIPLFLISGLISLGFINTGDCNNRLIGLKAGRLLSYDLKKGNGKIFRTYKDKIIDVKNTEKGKTITIHRRVLDKSGDELFAGFYSVNCRNEKINWSLKDYLFDYDKLWNAKGVQKKIENKYAKITLEGDDTKQPLEDSKIKGTLSNMGLVLVNVVHTVSERQFLGFVELTHGTITYSCSRISSIQRGKENNRLKEEKVTDYFNEAYGLIQRDVMDLKTGKLKYSISLSSIN